MFKELTEIFLRESIYYKEITSGDDNFKWHYCENKLYPLPKFGWKIHISANYSNAIDIQRIVIPYLIKNNLSFKHPASEAHLRYLNSGRGGLSQVGKFITIYVLNDTDFKHRIKKLTTLFKGKFIVPFIITDKRYDNDLPIFYRFGAITSEEFQNETGIYEKIISAKNEPITFDKRESSFILPDKIMDPFKNKGCVNFDYLNKYIGGKYVTFGKISDSYKAASYLGVDLKSNRFCFIKISKPYIEVEKNVFSSSLIINEARILKSLNCNHYPKFLRIFKDQESTVLVTSFIDGINLFDFIQSNAIQGIFFSTLKIKKIFSSILDNLKELEEKGIIHNDLKPNNILINKNLDTFLIDFETSFYKKENIIESSLKSRGYYSNKKNSNPDYYALSMILYFIQTAYNISDAPRENNIFERPLHYLTGKHNFKLQLFIQKLSGDFYDCVDSIKEDFFQCMEGRITPFNLTPRKIEKISDSYHSISRNIVNWLFNICNETNFFCYWKSTHIFNSGKGRMDINIGSAGILIFLSYFFINDGSIPDEYRSRFKKAIKFLIEKKYENQISGLFVGESGKVLSIIVSLISIGQFDIKIIKPHLGYIKNNLPTNNDLFNGKSGVGFMFLALYSITNNRDHLKSAIVLSKTIIEDHILDQGEIFWKDSLTKKNFLGFAHGIAGIGYFLNILYNFTLDEKLLKIIEQISTTLINHSIKNSNQSNLINWPSEPGEKVLNNHWCNGAAGIANFFLQFYKTTKDEKYLKILQKCSNTIIKSSSFMNPTMCHGLSGNLNFLINFYQVKKSRKLKAEIFRLSEVLKMAGLIKNNYFVFPSESPFIITPDFWVGCTGPAYVMHRLTNIDANFDFLSIEFYKKISKYYPTETLNSGIFSRI